jgi:hypothetical protein
VPTRSRGSARTLLSDVERRITHVALAFPTYQTEGVPRLRDCLSGVLTTPDDVVPWLDLAGRVAPDAAVADEVRRVSVRLLGDRAPPPPRPHRHTAPRGAGLSRPDLDLDAARTDAAKLRDR